ncbi:hypothetical protein IW139_006525, partial [Coemansia sp. RSA 353]
LSDDITELVNELGPQIYPEFSTTRISEQLGDGLTTHSNLINESADAFHRKMRMGEQALRQRINSTIGSRQTSPQSESTEETPLAGPSEDKPNQRRGSKYAFNPPTPRTMETLNSISPMEFLSTVTGAVLGTGSPSAESSDGKHEAGSQFEQTRRSTPEQKKGLFYFT